MNPLTPATPTPFHPLASTPSTPVPLTPSSIFALASKVVDQEDALHRDLQLAAELGKTLLERNKYLEGCLTQQTTRCEDQAMEIQYLQKQTAALREANESRLQIYEHLEGAFLDLEAEKRRVGAEALEERRRAKSLTAAVENMEQRNLELQLRLEELERDQEEGDRGGGVEKEVEPCVEVEKLRLQLVEAERALLEEAGRRRELQGEGELLVHEQHRLRKEVEELQNDLSSNNQSRSLDEEMRLMESHNYCHKCLEPLQGSVADPTDELLNMLEEEGEGSAPASTTSPRVVIRLANGGQAWGSQESLASAGLLPQAPSPPPPAPLCWELNAQYVALIDQYERNAREQKEREHEREQALVGSERVDDGHIRPESLHQTVMSAHRCQRCTNCTCGISKAISSGADASVDQQQRPKSASTTHTEYCASEGETFSSGFSSDCGGETRCCQKSTQTDQEVMASDDVERCLGVKIPREFVETITKFLDLKSPGNPCDQRFQSTPEYKKLFHEIFMNLKTHVLETEMKRNEAEADDVDSTVVDLDDGSVIGGDRSGSIDDTSSIMTADDNVSIVVSSVADDQFSVSSFGIEETEESSLISDACASLRCSAERACEEEKLEDDKEREPTGIETPLRPRSLDVLSHESVRSRSASRNRKRYERKMRLVAVQQAHRNANAAMRAEREGEERELRARQKEMNRENSLKLRASKKSDELVSLPGRSRNTSRRRKSRSKSRSMSEASNHPSVIVPSNNNNNMTKNNTSNNRPSRAPAQNNNNPITNNQPVQLPPSGKAANTKVTSNSKPPAVKTPKKQKVRQRSQALRDMLNKNTETKRFVEKYCVGQPTRVPPPSHLPLSHFLPPPAAPAPAQLPPPPPPPTNAGAMLAELRNLEQTYAQALKSSYRPSVSRL